jgi:mRNA interferase HigB
VEAEAPLQYWYWVAKKAKWRNLAEVKKDFGSADYVAPYTVFNIGGNKYRLIVTIKYKWQMVYIRHILTHREYDEGGWKR